MCPLNAAVVTLAKLSWETRNLNICAGPWVYNYLASKTRGYNVALTYNAAGHRCSAYTYSHMHMLIYEVCTCVPTHTQKGGRRGTHRWDFLGWLQDFGEKAQWYDSKNAVIGVGTIGWTSHPQRTLVTAGSKVMVRARRLACAGRLMIQVSIFWASATVTYGAKAVLIIRPSRNLAWLMVGWGTVA